MDDRQTDVCRVCRCEGTSDKPLFHPCVCTGSIKFIHQDCLVQWLKYSKKEYCELCKHRYLFTPIYAPDMPKRLPIKDLVSGLLRSVAKAVRYWIHYTLVAIAWLGIVPLTACRIYRCLFNGSISSLLTLPLDMLSTENLLSDCFQGCFVMTCTLCTFISLVWLREQIMHGGGPDWLDNVFMHHQPAPVVAPGNNNGPANAFVNLANEIAGPILNRDDANVVNDEEVEDSDHEEEEDDNHIDEAEVNNAGQEENNWNPIELDRVEELTWERLLGLDGSLLFMEHVFWVISLNTLFIFFFAFIPYHTGNSLVILFEIESWVSVTRFDGLLTTMIGYLFTALLLGVCHSIFSLLKFKKYIPQLPKRLLGMCYIVIKVTLLVVMEIGLFPLMCGWWLDICSLSMFDATLRDREQSFRISPSTSMFIHWLVGMVYIFYFASFILLLKEVLRPGVLWFLRNLNDPDFNPIQEMIHLPIYRHMRRFLASLVVFGSIVLIMLWLPVQLLHKILPSFLPFHVTLSSPDTPVSELSLELLLLQVVLPALLEQGHTRQWLKGLLKGWCSMVALILNLRSYLLGDVPLHDENNVYEKPEEVKAEENSESDTLELNATVENPDLVEMEVIIKSDIEQISLIELIKSSSKKNVSNDLSTNNDNLGDKIFKNLVEINEKNECQQKSETSLYTALSKDELSQSNQSTNKSLLDLGIDSFSNNLELEGTLPTCNKFIIKNKDLIYCLDNKDQSNIDIDNHKTILNLENLNNFQSEYNNKIDHSDINFKIKDYISDVITTSLDEFKSENVDFINYNQDKLLFNSLNITNNTSIKQNSKNFDLINYNISNQINNINKEQINISSINVNKLNNNNEIINKQLDLEVIETHQLNLPIVQAIVEENPVENVAAEQPAVENNNQAVVEFVFPQGLGDAHQALMQGGGPNVIQPYNKPDYFIIRILCLIFLMGGTLFLSSLISFVVPVYIGRKLMSIWTGDIKIHELYTAACGLYTCWVALRICLVLYTWLPQGWRAIANKLIEWALLISKTVFIATVMIGVIPLMLGILFELVIVIPIRVPLDQTPIFFPWQDWALGVLHAKIITACTLMGPQWKLKRVIEQVYNQGFRNMDLKFVLMELCIPVLVNLGLLLCVPLVIIRSIVPALGFNKEIQYLVERRIYPFMLGCFLLVLFCIFQARQFKRLYEHIKNDKYLVGQRLVNYEKKIMN